MIDNNAIQQHSTKIQMVTLCLTTSGIDFNKTALTDWWEVDIWVYHNCLHVCLDVNQDGTNCNCCTQSLVIFHVQAPTNKLWSQTKRQVGQRWHEQAFSASQLSQLMGCLFKWSSNVTLLNNLSLVFILYYHILLAPFSPSTTTQQKQPSCNGLHAHVHYDRVRILTV